MNKVKVFMHGYSQAVRLPKKFRFKTKEVSIIQLGNGLILQPMPKTWKEVFQELASIPTDDILIGREDLPPQEREYFSIGYRHRERLEASLHGSNFCKAYGVILVP